MTVVVPQASLQESLDHFRSIGATGISAVQPRYVYHEESVAFRGLLRALGES